MDYKKNDWCHSYKLTYSDSTFSGYLAKMSGLPLPVTVSAKHNWKVSGCTDFKSSYTLDENLQVHNEVEHKIDGNWKLGLNQHYYTKRVGTKDPVDVGFELSYKL